MSEAIYLAEFKSISRGISILDQMLKAGSLNLLHADPVCIGKYLIVVGGDVADVKEAQKVAIQSDKGFLAGKLITGTHPAILEYFRHTPQKPSSSPSSIGIVETFNISAGFSTLDQALKSGQIELLKLWMGRFIGGKMCYVLGGEISDVSAALAGANQSVDPMEIAGTELIASPDSVVMERFYHSTN